MTTLSDQLSEALKKVATERVAQLEAYLRVYLSTHNVRIEDIALTEMQFENMITWYIVRKPDYPKPEQVFVSGPTTDIEL